MINEVILVGKIRSINKENQYKSNLELEVERPFRDGEGRVSDIFNCKLWNSIFNKVISFSKAGDLLAIKGRIENDNSSYLVVAENVVILNKSSNNILKQD